MVKILLLGCKNYIIRMYFFLNYYFGNYIRLGKTPFRRKKKPDLKGNKGIKSKNNTRIQA